MFVAEFEACGCLGDWVLGSVHQVERGGFDARDAQAAAITDAATYPLIGALFMQSPIMSQMDFPTREMEEKRNHGKEDSGVRRIGYLRRGAKVRLLRDNVVIHEGALKTLKRFKDEVREVRDGYECGMAFENYENIQVGDTIECFEVEEVARAL